MANTVLELLLDMKMLDNGLEINLADATGRQEAAAIRALTSSQHTFENIIATRPRTLETEITTVSTTALGEKTVWPTNLLRIDEIWLLDSAGKQLRRLYNIDEPGGHAPSYPWPISVFPGPTGAPYAYYANQQNFYWLNLPDAIYNFRIFGLIEQAEFTARANAFNYPARTRLAVAEFAIRLMKTGLDDDTDELDKSAQRIFAPVLKSLRNFIFSGPKGRTYTQPHFT